ncbi:MAG: peptide deformylase [Candidatus Melainabacteria bacterium]|nr:peptide deformylase [Candidatus Melainabacteria bacterium]
MAILKVYKYPHPVLRAVCEPVVRFDSELRALVADMVETMYQHPGAVGLAAPQVGVPLRLFIMDITAKTTQSELKILINPHIVKQSRNKSVREGCLSFPDYLVNSKRATRLTVEAVNENGEPICYTVADLEAIAIQHELDHLEGVLMIDRIDSLKTDLIRRRGQPVDDAPGEVSVS